MISYHDFDIVKTECIVSVSYIDICQSFIHSVQVRCSKCVNMYMQNLSVNSIFL